ncbi:putative neprosin [Helianthus annuus]|nr:putative neprosin [Helianthus annuus]KAJ0676793.1 putative neprosin [Helianthus annuus]
MLQHAIGFVHNEEFYGAKAVLNVWKPDVIGNDFSLSQIWVLSNFPGRSANSIEAGWQVSSSLAILFIYYSDLFRYIQKYIFVLNLFIFYQNVTKTITIFMYALTLFYLFIFILNDWLSK